jgi:hypothetical protein
MHMAVPGPRPGLGSTLTFGKERTLIVNITGFLIMDGTGMGIPADPFENNVAFCSSGCGHPVLATALPDQPGSDEEHPAKCLRCGRRYFLDVRQQAQKIYIHALG